MMFGKRALSLALRGALSLSALAVPTALAEDLPADAPLISPKSVSLDESAAAKAVLRLRCSMYEKDDTVMLPLRSLMSRLGYSYSYSKAAHTATYQKDGEALTIAGGKAVVQKEEDSFEMSRAAELHRGTLYVPVGFFAALNYYPLVEDGVVSLYPTGNETAITKGQSIHLETEGKPSTGYTLNLVILGDSDILSVEEEVEEAEDAAPGASDTHSYILTGEEEGSVLVAVTSTSPSGKKAELRQLLLVHVSDDAEDEDGGALKTMIVGETYSFSLPENPSTGYSLTATVKGDAIKVADSFLAEDDDGEDDLPGAPGERTFVIEAVKEGSAILTVVSARSGDAEGGVVMGKEFKVQGQLLQGNPAIEDPAMEEVIKKRLSVGETFTFQLEENPTTGYSLQPSIDGDAVSIVDDKYVSSSGDESIAGAGGVHTYTVRADKKGAAKLTVVYARPWDPKSASVVATYEFTID